MINAYFDYSPVGESVLVIEDADRAARETHLSIQDPASLVEAVTAFIQVNNVGHVYCNAAALGLVDTIREQLATQYNYFGCEFSQYA